MNTAHHAYFSSEPLKMHTHYHDCHQILFVLKGEVEFSVNDVPHRASAGHLIIFSRYENHSLTVLTEEYHRYVLEISPFAGTANKIYALLANRPEGFHNVLNVSGEAEDFRLLFDQITAESQGEHPLHIDMTELLIQQLLIRIYRCFPPMSVSLEDESYEYIFELQNRFETNCSCAYSLETLAHEYNISPSTLSHHFKKVTGSSVMDYLMNCRMAQAKKYLTETSLRIGEIIERCGFSDSSNFSRAFKKLNGVSPSRFRERYRN